MVFIVKVINGVKKIIPVTADVGAGLPVGTIIAQYKKTTLSGYLYLDGSTFDQTAYPLLYAYLGSNVLPDYREFALVGAEQNTTSSNIATHDVYTEGQEKDDQFQDHGHKKYWIDSAGISINNDYPGTYNFQDQYNSVIENGASGRAGTTTRGKRKAVYFYIKATSGLSENAQDNVINTLNEERSYSTEEHLTGKKWIDGKPIYSIVLTTTSSITNSSSSWGGLQTEVSNLNIEKCISVTAISANGANMPIQLLLAQGFKTYGDVNTGTGADITLEYTKTT